MKTLRPLLFCCAVLSAQTTGPVTVTSPSCSVTAASTGVTVVCQQPATMGGDPLATPPTIDTNAADYPSNIWVTGPMVKVRQEDAPAAATAPKWITVHASKGESQSFQVHVHAGATAVTIPSITVSDLVNAGTHISAASTDIVVYREQYMNVTIPTSTSATYLNVMGHIPDILLPAVDPYFHQVTNAFPFTVAPNTNQSFWVDVHVPTTAPSGYYLGAVTIGAASAPIAKLPIVYAVWDWTMPASSSLPSITWAAYGGMCTQAYAANGCGAYPSADGNADLASQLADVDAAVQMLDNRYTLIGSVDTFPGAGSFLQFNSIWGCLPSGVPCTNTKTILPGAKSSAWIMDILASAGQFTEPTFANWQAQATKAGWNPLVYWTADEPGMNAATWALITSAATTEHGIVAACAAAGTPCPIPTMSTTDLPTATAFSAQNLVDMLVVDITALEPTKGIQPLANYQAWIAAAPAGMPTRAFWSYQACSSAGTCTNGIPGTVLESQGGAITYPNYNVDGTPLANRMMEWMTYLHGQTGELYYFVDICSTTGDGQNCGVGSPGVTTPPTNPLLNCYYAGGWGDGTLMYAASASYAGTKTPIWLPSLRLKMIRDGMQDYEYMHALSQLGKGAAVSQQIATVVTNSYTFTSSPAVLEAARDAMGQLLHTNGISK